MKVSGIDIRQTFGNKDEALKDSDKEVIKRPKDADANWAHKIDVAVRAMEAGKQARQGKPALFQTR